MIDDQPRDRALKKQQAGVLYLVATPIGNLKDLSFRALETLKGVDRILCEDTRNSRFLMDHYGIDRPLQAFHDHNEALATSKMVELMEGGESLALISDAGTPLINDPGFPLVVFARAKGIQVIPIPGACALIAALSASGLPAHRFAFEGFPPRKSAARQKFFESLSKETRTLLFYESSHRLIETLDDLRKTLEVGRRLVIGREITKRFETFLETTVLEASERVREDENMQKGELVLVLEGADPRGQEGEIHAEAHRILKILLGELSVKSAARMAADITGLTRDTLYQEALRLKGADKNGA